MWRRITSALWLLALKPVRLLNRDTAWPRRMPSTSHVRESRVPASVTRCCLFSKGVRYEISRRSFRSQHLHRVGLNGLPYFDAGGNRGDREKHDDRPDQRRRADTRVYFEDHIQEEPGERPTGETSHKGG